MTSAVAWPDRDLYRAAVHNAARCFDDPLFQSAEFARAPNGMPAAWSGARSIVFCARTTAQRSLAVRFGLSDDAIAARRYAALGDYLRATPLACFVRADWIDDGVRLNGRAYPLLVMEWVEGLNLENEVQRAVESGTAGGHLAQLARAWRDTARVLAVAGIGHGDIHAGNILVDMRGPNVPRLRLIDYDNVSLPGVHLPCGEAGHPAFQHPRRTGGTTGPDLDAFSGTLTYLSLTALARDPSGWAHHWGGDDALVFAPDDLTDTTRPVWQWLGASSDAVVRSLADVTAQWLAGDPAQYGSLEQVIVAARASGAGATRPVANVWPPVPHNAPAAPTTSPAPVEPQRWPTATTWQVPSPVQPIEPPPARPGTPPASDSVVGRWVLALVLLAIVAYAIWH